jgi:hypothetical protein
MLTTGNQLRAARALVDMDQGSLADRAGVNINTISAMEKRGDEILTSGLDKVRAVMTALEAAGVEFLNHGKPGVQLRWPSLDLPARVMWHPPGTLAKGIVWAEGSNFDTLRTAVRFLIEEQPGAEGVGITVDGWAGVLDMRDARQIYDARIRNK